MIALSGQLPSLVALAAHVAICVTAVSLAGAAALWICRGRSAPLRHAMALGFLVATLAVPAIAALYQYRLLRFDFASPTQSMWATITAKPNAGPVAVPVEEPATAGTRPDNGPTWSFIACAASRCMGHGHRDRLRTNAVGEPAPAAISRVALAGDRRSSA